MSPDEAKMKWCPWSSTLSVVDEGPAVNRALPGMREQQADNIFFATRCLAEGCAAWRWHPARVSVGKSGYCGVSGAAGSL
jgi:hypothetical protein